MSYLKQYLTLSDEIDSSLGFKVKSINTKLGAHLYKGKKICELLNIFNNTSVNIKAEHGGIVSELYVQVGNTISIGDSLIEVKACLHPTILGNICCDCGVVLEKNSNVSQENKTEGLVSMLHSIPDLKVSKEEATRVGNEDIKHLLDKRKLVLLVDLDQTLIHTTNDNIPPKLKNVFHFQLIPNGPWYHTRIRPYTDSFLKNISKLYELHICTFGVREYAHCIASFLDSDRKLFGDRILSRNECLDPMSKKANLSSLFPCGDNLVCIIDDRSDVWNFAPNVVQVMPYHFFQHTGDINAPPGLQKKENDNTSRGYDFSNMEEFSSNKKKEKGSEEEDKEEKDTTSSEKKNKLAEKEESELYSEEDEKSQSKIYTAKETRTDEKEVKETSESQKDSIHNETKENDDPDKINLDKDTKKNYDPDEVHKEINKNDDPEDVHKKNNKNGGPEEVHKNLKENDIPDVVQKEIDEKDGPEVVHKEIDEKDGSEVVHKEIDEKDGPEVVHKEIDENDGPDVVHKEIDENDGPEVVQKEIDEKDGPEVVHKEIDESDCPDESYNETKDWDDTLDFEPIKSTDSDTLDVEDDDDYLLYLEDILTRLHSVFYYDYKKKLSQKKEELPDLKEIVPDTRKKVLGGCHLVLSGVVPQNTSLLDSKAYHIATSLGATVYSKIIAKAKGKDNPDLNYTTHVVAANLHTEKFHQAKRLKNIKIVTPNWLWCCAERWEHVDERLFELTNETETSIIRNPPMHCLVNSNKHRDKMFPERPVQKPPLDVKKLQNEREDENVFKSLNPLAFMSDDETKSMENEVDDILSEEGEESQDHQVQDNESSNSEEDSYIENNTNEFNEDDDDEEYGTKKKRKLTLNNDDFDDDEDEEEEEEELPSIRFRQGGYLSSEDNDSESGDDEDMNAYGDILERELMGD